MKQHRKWLLDAAVRACACAVCVLAAQSAEASGPSPPGLYVAEHQDATERDAEPEIKEFSLINYFFVRGTFTNQLADPSGLRGVSLGPLGPGAGVASSTGVDNDRTAAYIEQRWIPVIQYSPLFADGLATFRAQFEIDYTWGVAANAVQNNQGGGFNADQVNIQTKNVNVAITPTRKAKELSILVGTQSVYDTIYDPTITSLFDIVRTGYKLTFMGTDATALSVFGRKGDFRGKASYIPIAGAQPDLAEGNPQFTFASLVTADAAWELQPGTTVGASAWRLTDNTRSRGFVFQGLVNTGPSSSGLSGFTGTQPFNIEQADGHVNYLGAHFHHNINYRTGDLGASGFAMYNFGRYENQREGSTRQPFVDIRGLAANLELTYNWGKTEDDEFTLEGIYTTGDSDPTDGSYSSPFTLNYYGLPGAVWFNHKTLILFPFTQVVSNYTGAVTDISNQGFGLTAGILTGAWDIIPQTLNLKLGVAAATSSADPDPQELDPTPGSPGDERTIDRGRFIGAEVNAELVYEFRYLMSVGLHGAYMVTGSFYDDNDQVQDNPFALFTTFTWYAF